MQTILFVGLGGMAGTLSRYGIVMLCRAYENARALQFPLGTLAVNVLGCLLLGVCAGLMDGKWEVSKAARAGITAGFFGGFTTFSAYAFESGQMLQDGNWRGAFINIALQNVVGLAAAMLGYRLAI